MKDTHKEFVEKIQYSIRKHIDNSKETDSYFEEPDVLNEMNLQIELEKRLREIFGEEE